LRALRREAQAGRPYDIALIDRQMPGMSGIDLAAEVKRDGAIAATRLLMLSSIVSRTSHEMRMAEIDACLTKPVKQSQLLDSLMQAASREGAQVKQPVDLPSVSDSLPAQGAHSGLSHLRILVAEDNITNQKVALGLLRRLGCRNVDAVANGSEVLEALATVPYDVVLMDCQMPEMDGYEATTRIRRREAASKHTIVIAMTAHAMAGEREKCLRAGMDDYLSKPVKLEELARVLKRWAATLPGPRAPSTNDSGHGQAALLNPEVLAELRSYQDGLLGELIDSYLLDLTDYLSAMRVAIDARDYTQLAKITHTLRGSSGSIGATEMAKLCAELERMARNASPEGADALMARIEAESLRVRHALGAQRTG
jgi:CheY-like chemotaxis protein/HPt (histidine-containing phosphotransfer) domain-containing protein